MQWIKENSIITITIFISLLFHSIIMLYNKEERIIKENIIAFEIVKQIANTQISQEIKQNETSENKVDKKQKTVKKEEIYKDALIKKETAPKKQVTKKENTDTIQSAGVNKINNQAETYIKQNYNQIQQEIVSRIIYPPRAKKLGIEGSGYLLIAIDKTGTIISVKAFDFPNKLLQDAALKAAKQVGYVASHEMVSNV
ncbi:MAG: energy transducer TonB, partial [Mucispirillum sp.]|nr:energy transducer TonB [Mucispirillum sp.]